MKQRKKNKQNTSNPVRDKNKIDRNQRKLSHNISTFKDRVYVQKYPFEKSSDFEMCFSPEALNNLLKTVGSRRPETGAKGFSPIISSDPNSNDSRIGFDIIEFDERGSRKASHSMYSPDQEWGTERVEHYFDAEELRIWTGDIHSHPGKGGYPSPESGDGLGDLGYVRKVFDNHQYLDFFLLPIITIEGRKIVIHPWIIDRKDPSNPLIAKNVKVCSASDFPIIDLDTSSLEPTIDAMYKLITDLSDRFDALEESMKKEIKNLSEEIGKLRKTNQNPPNHTLDILDLTIPLPFPWGDLKMTCLGSFNFSKEITATASPTTSPEDESKQMEVL